MGGFKSVTGGVTTMSADNVDFTGNALPTPQVSTNGQLLIGATASPNIRVGSLTSPNSSISIGYSAPNITIDVASVVPDTFTADDATTATPSANDLIITGGGTGLSTTASGHTIGLASTGILKLANGGTNADLTASDGGIFYSTASAGAILAGTATARQMLQSGASTTPAWSTTTWPATTTASQLLYSSATSVVGEVTLGDYGVLISSSAGVPSWLTNGTTGQVLTATTSGIPSWANASGGATTFDGDNGSATPSAGVITFDAISQAGATVQFVGSGSTMSLQVYNTSTTNQFVGNTCGNSSGTGTVNTCFGYNIMNSGWTNGTNNCCFGYQAGSAITGGGSNVIMGVNAAYKLTTGSSNTIIGGSAGSGTSFNGTNNILLGLNAGLNYTGTEGSNIIIGSYGVVGESSVIRIGTPGIGSGMQGALFIAGTRTGTSPSSGYLGEQIISVIPLASAVTITTSGTSQNLTSITLTPGVWNISALVTADASTVITGIDVGISTTTNTLPTQDGVNFVNMAGISAVVFTTSIPSSRVATSASTTAYYLVVNCTFTGSCSMWGNISATRVA